MGRLSHPSNLSRLLGLLRLTTWPWPLPALLAWAMCWTVYRATIQDWIPVVALGLATACGVALSVLAHSWWRRLLMGAGFPLSLALTGSQTSLGLGAMPAWAWLVPLVLLLLIYPLNAWRDAPLFPTPKDALQELPHFAPLAPGADILDAGCGAGDGLLALQEAYADAQLHGLEWSWPLRWLSALRCPSAKVRRGDIWIADWSAYDMVYLFQRPESMTRAVIKAAEMREGAWLVSLEFEASHLRPAANYQTPGGKTVWIYQIPVVYA